MSFHSLQGSSHPLAYDSDLSFSVRVPSSGNLDKQTGKGSTALHYCCLTDNAECLKLLLRGKASIEIGKPRGVHWVLGLCWPPSASFPQLCTSVLGAFPTL